MRLKLSIVPYAAILTVWCGLVVGCSDKGTEPKPPEIKDYLVHFTDTEDNILFSYNPATRSLDSSVFPFRITGIKATPDGRELYLITMDSTVIYDLKSKTITVFSRPQVSVAFSPDGLLYVRQGRPIQVLRRTDDSAIFQDTSLAFGVHFSDDNRIIVGMTPSASGSKSIGYRADLNSSSDIFRRTFAGNLMLILPTTDGAKWFLLELVFGDIWSFETYDVSTDSIVFSMNFAPGWGWMALTPDNKYLFYTNPGDIISHGGPESPNTITVFDVERNTILKEIPTGTLVPTDSGDVWMDFPVSLIHVTADGRWLVGLGAYPFGIVVTVDIQSLEVVRYEVLGMPRQLFYLSTQSVP